MKKNKRYDTYLGAALLLQAVSSLTAGAFLKAPLVAEGDISATIALMINNPLQVTSVVVIELITAFGIIWLGSCFYHFLKKQDRFLALTAFGAYLLEAIFLVISRCLFFAILQTTQLSTIIAEEKEELAQFFMTMSDLTADIFMTGFSIGAILFYYLLVKSRLVPKGIALWGFITVIPICIATFLRFFHIFLPIVFYAPYVPFEFFLGAWILIKGLNHKTAAVAEGIPE